MDKGGKQMSTVTMLTQLGKGMISTAEIFSLTLLFSLPLGLLVSFGRMSRNRLLQAVTRFYITIMRGTPLMLQLLVVYFAPYYLFGLNLRGYRFPAIILAFSINYAAYFAEIYRGGIASMAVGQYEAAQVLGYSRLQTFFKIILPQVMKRILPSITNETITLVKDTSLAFVLAQAEMFTMAKQIAAKDTSMMPLMAAGVFYYIFNFVVAFAMERIEKAMDYYR
jgi:polar amino acid transport system permease protein